MKTTNRPYLLFDLGNVLIDLDIPATYHALEDLTRLQASAFKAFLDEKAWLHHYETGQLSDEEFLNGLLAFATPGTSLDTLKTAWNAMLKGIPVQRLRWLAHLRNAFNVGLLSNTNGIHLAWVHHYLNVTHKVTDFEQRFFDHVFYSHHIGAKKPDPESFERVLHTLNIASGDILFIDDLEDNVRAAIAAGMKAVHHPVGEEIMFCLPDYLRSCGWELPVEFLSDDT
jgi:FMN phosphatase YigB (HAD superfamily)